jgi:hypothetical protein
MQWEYFVLKCPVAAGGQFDKARLEHDMNWMGHQGWELASSLYAGGVMGIPSEGVLLFKRPRVPTASPANR